MTEKPTPLPERIDRFAKKLMGVKPRRDPRREEGPLFATFQDRVIASVIDMGVIFILLQDVFKFITVKVFSLADLDLVRRAYDVAKQNADANLAIQSRVDAAFDSGLFDLWLLNSFAQSLLIGAILIIMWREFHTTLGKWIIGLEFAGKHGEGQPSLKQYFMRFLGFYLSMPIFMIGFALLGFDKEKRAWHDRIGGTTVIYSKRGSIFRQAWDWIKARFKR